jgi:hypothetical protein
MLFDTPGGRSLYAAGAACVMRRLGKSFTLGEFDRLWGEFEAFEETTSRIAHKNRGLDDE